MAVKIETQESDARTPSHFICLVDVSTSMEDENKLHNVQHCLKVLLALLTPQDEFSLVTFGDAAKTHCKRMKMTSINADTMKQTIDGLKACGLTNLSAGLGLVNDILKEGAGSAAGPSGQKQGLLLLTDGHANQGLRTDQELREILGKIRQGHHALSVSIIGYGTDHNADLLKEMADDCIGGYSIVETMEGAALAIGEALGGVLSCCAQNVRLVVPPGTTVLGPYKVKEESVQVGDLYSGTQTMILLEGVAPGAALRLQGTYMPSLESFDLAPLETVHCTRPSALVGLTILRYRSADLFRKIREYTGPARAIKAEVAAFAAELDNPLFAGYAELVQMMRSQVESMYKAIEAVCGGRRTVRFHNLLVQQEAFAVLGRGASMPIQLDTPVLETPVLETPVLQRPADEDPQSQTASRTPSGLPSAPPPTYFLSPTSSMGQQRMARTLQRMTASRRLSEEEGEPTA